jgi:hypothetical protein
MCLTTLEESEKRSLPTDQSLVSQGDLHNIHPTELWITRKGFGPLAYCCQDTAVFRYF